MTKWTNEQLRAINETGKNIIVSAGAGSGKTAVLTERVITKLQQGININSLLILTFTNAAASEMKNRIRDGISDIKELQEQLSYIDTAYITTFDSFMMSLVKKYYYLLNINPNVSIMDGSISISLRSKYIDDIFLDLYKSKDECFLKLINDFTIKDDKLIKNAIIRISDKIDKLINKDEYLDNYINNYYSSDNINKLVSDYNDLLLDKINEINSLVMDLETLCDNDFYTKYLNSIKPLLLSTNYNSIKSNIDFKSPRLPNNSSDDLKNIKSLISDKVKDLKSDLIYENIDDIKCLIYNTKDYVSSIIDIIKRLNSKLNEYKKYNDVYEFNDIAQLVINLLKSNNEVRLELKNKFNEIMVDEYQDTSDIQEEFINLISNNNVYMVGDIKQSIYRFRNANPDIFKDKYEKYQDNIGGIKIDLLNNFRSRKEVLSDINNIFDYVMDSNVGGADYKKSHRMIFGNLSYEEFKNNQNYNLEILNYKRDLKEYDTSEYEAFIICNDIKNRINNNEMIFDRKLGILRKIEYKDFCILIDRKSKLEIYKKIFEYNKIPLMIFYDEKITGEADLLILKNIIELIIKIHNKEFDTRFKYDIYSINRSYLFNKSDLEYIEEYNSNNFYNDLVYIKCKKISDKLDTLSNKSLIDEIVNEFNMYEKVVSVGDIKKFSVRIDYLRNLATSLSNLGYDIYSFSNYLQELVLNDSNIVISENVRDTDSVKLMNIHKSKGLEYPVCYFAGFSSTFNRDELKESINFDNKYGFIIPSYKDGLINTITYKLYCNKYVKEDISERIRLLYVALTRAREKMIIVGDFNNDREISLDKAKSEYKSFNDIIVSIKDYLLNNIVNIDNIELTKKYKVNKSIDKLNINSNKINVNEFYIDNNIINKEHVSKSINKLISSSDIDKMKYGTYIHELLEVSDFNNSDNEIVNNIINCIGNIDNSNIYKEYEFITSIDNKKYHGIIDLIIEYDDCIKIIDYKLKNINDIEYKKQLNIYREYISSITNKKVYTYLYSIIDNILTEV